jgi:hypothetical protein
MGGGKSWAALQWAINKFKYPHYIMIVVPTHWLVYQWYSLCISVFSINDVRKYRGCTMCINEINSVANVNILTYDLWLIWIRQNEKELNRMTIIFDEIHYIWRSPIKKYLKEWIRTSIDKWNTIMLSGSLDYSIINKINELHKSNIPILIKRKLKTYEPFIINYNPQSRHIEDIIKQIYYTVKNSNEIAIIFVETISNIIDVVDLISLTCPLIEDYYNDVPPVAYFPGNDLQLKVVNNLYKIRISLYYRNMGKLYTRFLEERLNNINDRKFNFMIMTTAGAEGMDIPNISFIVKFSGIKNYFNTSTIVDQIIHRGSRDRVSITYIPNNQLTEIHYNKINLGDSWMIKIKDILSKYRSDYNTHEIYFLIYACYHIIRGLESVRYNIDIKTHRYKRILNELSSVLKINSQLLQNCFILISDLFVNGRINYFRTLYSYLSPLSFLSSFQTFGREMESHIKVYDENYIDGLFYHLPNFDLNSNTYMSLMTLMFPLSNKNFEWLCIICQPVQVLESNIDIILKGMCKFWRFSQSDLITYISYIPNIFVKSIDQIFELMIELE